MANETSSDQIQNLTSSLYCSMFPAKPNYCTVIINVRRVFASLSLIGCLFMIFVIWLFKKYAAFSQRMILYLSIAALASSISYLMCMILYLSIAALASSISYLMGDLHPDGPVCDFQAFWMTFFDWSVLLWISCITLNLFCNIVKGITTEGFEWLYHIFCWGLALFISCLPFIGDHYGPAGAWCWIKDNWAWRLGIWYGPLFCMLFILMVVYIYISCILSRKVSTWAGTYDPDTERSKQMLKEDIKPLRAYPFVYLAVSLFPLINRIQNALDSQHHVFALVLLASISAPLHGAINAVVFGMDKETLSRLSPSQIKMALEGRFSKNAIIREYPETYEDMNTTDY